MKDKFPTHYIYPAVFTFEEGQEIAVVFPDLNCATGGVDFDDALESGRECIDSRLALMEEDGVKFLRRLKFKILKWKTMIK